MPDINIESEWLVKKSEELGETIKNQAKICNKTSVLHAAEALGGINVINEIFDRFLTQSNQPKK